jgi:hypothetical protein
MDLSSLLNTQREESNILSLKDIQLLLSNADSSAIIDKIRAKTVFSYPPQRSDSFVFFDTFLQLLLCIDDHGQYTKSIVIDSFRNCMNGLLHQHDNGWLIEFPAHLTSKTWIALRDQKDGATILVYLYGLVLTLTANSPAWIEATMQFMKSNHLGIVIHLWLTCCCTLDDNEVVDSDNAKLAFLNKLEYILKQGTTTIAKDMINMLKNKDTQYLMTHVNNYLGGALAKPMFTNDDFHIGYFSIQTACQIQSFRYSLISKLFQESKGIQSARFE